MKHLKCPPDVEWEDVPGKEQKEIEQSIDIQSEGAGEKEEIGKVDMDIEGKGAQTAGGTQVIRGSWVDEYSRIFGAYAKRFLDIFAKEPEVEEIHSRTGRIPDMNRVAIMAPDPFIDEIEEDTRPQISLGITVDVSGSITSNGRLVKGFTLMSKFFLSLLYSAAKLRKEGVWYGLSAIGEKFHEGLPLAQRHTEKALENIVSSDDNQWMNAFNGGDGINTVSLLTGLRKKWENSNIPRENKLEIIFTDGGETSGAGFGKLREIAEQFEQDTGVTLVFVGIGTKEVANYHRYIILSAEPKPEEFINIISKLGVRLARRGRLDSGDLTGLAGIAPKEPLSLKMPAPMPIPAKSADLGLCVTGDTMLPVAAVTRNQKPENIV